MYNPSTRYKRRAAEQKRKMMWFTLFLCLLALFFYWVGGQVVRSSESAYKQQSLQLSEEKQEIEEKFTNLDASLQSLKMEYGKLQEQYKSEVPTGEVKNLLDLTRKQIEDGIETERLALAIRSARPPRNCTPPVTKRFIVRTPFYNGPDSFVSFGHKSLTVTATGSAAVTGQKKEAWYDPGKPVKVKFTRLGGKDIIKEGLLPLHSSVVIGDKEHRFTIAKGKRSFIDVTSDSCDYP